MKIYGFSTMNNGCGKYRVWEPLAAIERAGAAEVRREPDVPQSISIERAEEIFEWADVVHCQPFSQLWAACMIIAARDQTGKKLVVDLDDDVWAVHPMNVGPVDGKLVSLKSHFNGNFQDFWKLEKLTKEEAREYKDRIDGTLVKNEKGEIFFLKNTQPDAKLSVEFMVQNCDAITTTNHVLANSIRKHTDKPIHVVTNRLHFPNWKKAKLPEKPWIGWCGSVSHYPDLRPLMPSLDKLMDRYPDLGIQMMGSSFDYLFPLKDHSKALPVSGFGPEDGMFYASIEDSGERWPGRMNFHKPVPVQEFDNWICSNWQSQIGIAPIERNDFNDAKSELKWLEYTAMGIPVVASEFGPYKRAIRHGLDGLLVNIPEFWFPAINELLKDEAKRAKLVKNATERLHSEYDIDKHYTEWLEVFENCEHSSPAALDLSATT